MIQSGPKASVARLDLGCVHKKEINCLVNIALCVVAIVVFLLLHVVVLPDHLLSALHDRTRDPTSRCPSLQVIEAWEPYADPHEKEVMEPYAGG